MKKQIVIRVWVSCDLTYVYQDTKVLWEIEEYWSVSFTFGVFMNKFNYIGFFIFFLLANSCQQESGAVNRGTAELSGSTYVQVLGIAQDAGFPQANCKKSCCASAWAHPEERQMVSCIAVVDTISKKYWIVDATPDFKDQLQLLTEELGPTYELGGIFLTHAHIGHYTGLMHLGHEVMGAKDVPVYVMPRMASFLRQNGPWAQLVELQNISLKTLQADSSIALTSRLQVTPFLVPHRDEYSETVGFSIITESKSLLFIPDIDKWEKWDRDIITEVESHNYALLDATFYKNGEIPNRDMSQIPHPFVEETMQTFAKAERSAKNKIHFIHLNHTNPLLQSGSTEIKEVRTEGYDVCYQGQVFSLD